MSIRPIDFNGMIQNTNNVHQAKAQDDSKAVLQQSNLMIQGEEREAEQNTQVQRRDDASKEQFNPNEGGDGTGYQGNQGRKQKKDKVVKKDVIRKKNEYRGSLDIKI